MRQCFIDTNLLVYANDQREIDKQSRAIEVIQQLMRAQNGMLSIQVLQEYANVAIKKLRQESAVVLRQLKLLESLRVISPNPAMVRRSIEICVSYQVGFWNAGIIAAAESGDADLILSEDLNAGQFYAGIEIINPFSNDFDLTLYIS